MATTGETEIVPRVPSPESRVPTSSKLWGGRFSTGPAPAMDALNRSIGVDFRLWPFDIALSKAWALALWQAGVLTLEESGEMDRGLEKVAQRIAAGAQPVASDEDVHTMIDRLLREEIGTLGARLHTGRSRNDQVATATRLWTMDAVTKLDNAIRGVQEVIVQVAESLGDAMMPSYTHLQRAQPVLAAHWMLAHFWPLERDRARLADAAKRVSVLPLGSGAIAGSAYPIDRVLLKESLGFAQATPNSIDAVGDRDFVAEITFVATMLATHLSRLSEDLILFGSSEFGFVRFGDQFATGSSMMPQKRNPDALELARGSAARTLGDLVSVLGTIKGLPSGYNKDLQDDKRVLFDAVDTMLLVLPAVAGTLGELTFNRDRMASALSSTMMATDLADYLVRKGATFRESHSAVGRLVREAEELGCEMTELPQRAFTSAHALFAEDVYEALGARASIGHREVVGGTGPEAVADQLDAARRALLPLVETQGRVNDLRWVA